MFDIKDKTTVVYVVLLFQYCHNNSQVGTFTGYLYSNMGCKAVFVHTILVLVSAFDGRQIHIPPKCFVNCADQVIIWLLLKVLPELTVKNVLKIIRKTNENL